ncbi:hypothetical protein [Tannockella kyphosi]|uniref:hypothetical protein n=1 Tax=Tannockella kyphosi TaxID=2899121 RepID=UPI0020111BF5|nr:hypothetical protein [Tannockella kyphosi]
MEDNKEVQTKMTDLEAVEILKEQRINQKELMYDKIPEKNRPIIIKVLNAIILFGILIFAGIIIGAMAGFL